MTQRHLQVTVQAQLGALDRVLGALTHRGFIPQSFEAVLSEDLQSQRVGVVFDCDDDHTIDKLVNFLDKQVQVLQVTLAHPVSQ